MPETATSTRSTDEDRAARPARARLPHRPWTTIALVVHATTAGLGTWALGLGILGMLSGPPDPYLAGMATVVIVTALGGLLVCVALLIWTAVAINAADGGRPQMIAPLAWTQLVLAVMEVLGVILVAAVGGFSADASGYQDARAGLGAAFRVVVDTILIVVSIRLLHASRSARTAR